MYNFAIQKKLIQHCKSTMLQLKKIRKKDEVHKHICRYRDLFTVKCYLKKAD